MAPHALRPTSGIGWILGQRQVSSGLYRSYANPGDKACWTYDQALAAIDLSIHGRYAEAKALLQALGKLKGGSAYADGYCIDGSPIAKAQAVGPNCWLGLAALWYGARSGDWSFLPEAQAIATWVMTYQVTNSACQANGSVSGGLDENGAPFRWTSTEHNADALAFLAAMARYDSANRAVYTTAAMAIDAWLRSQMWSAAMSRFEVGYDDTATCTRSTFSEWLDSQTWTYLALHATGPNAPSHYGLPAIPPVLVQVPGIPIPLYGYGKRTLPPGDQSLWVEGTCGALLVQKLRGQLDTRMLASVLAAVNPDSGYKYSAGISEPGIGAMYPSSALIVAHFETHPNALGGAVGSYGDACLVQNGWPYAWYYTPTTPGYSANNVNSGSQSFSLAKCQGSQGYASLGLLLGPDPGVTCASASPLPLNASAFTHLGFYAKSTASVMKLIVGFRDANGQQVLTLPIPLSTSWTLHSVPLPPAGLNLAQLVEVSFEYGLNSLGNPVGVPMFLDDVMLSSGDPTTLPKGKTVMPEVFPSHWPYSSIAGTAWVDFVSAGINPFNP